MHPCGKGHPHNTVDGRDRCNIKYTDKRIKRIMQKGPPIYRKSVYNPPKVVDKGFIKVYIFQEYEVIR